jgi:hypothetical protein
VIGDLNHVLQHVACFSLLLSNQEHDLSTITSCGHHAAADSLGNISGAPSGFHHESTCQFTKPECNSNVSQVGASVPECFFKSFMPVQVQSRATTLIPERAHPSKGPDVEEWGLCKDTWPGNASGASDGGSFDGADGANSVNSALWLTGKAFNSASASVHSTSSSFEKVCHMVSRDSSTTIDLLSRPCSYKSHQLYHHLQNAIHNATNNPQAPPAAPPINMTYPRKHSYSIKLITLMGTAHPWI